MKGDQGHRRVNRPPGYPTYETLVDNMVRFAQPTFKPTPEDQAAFDAAFACWEDGRQPPPAPEQLEFAFMREMPLARAPAKPL